MAVPPIKQNNSKDKPLISIPISHSKHTEIRIDHKHIIIIIALMSCITSIIFFIINFN